MLTTAVIFTGIISAIGFILNGLMLYLVLSIGRQRYHYLFAAVLCICAIWDLGIFLSMLRNSHEGELIVYGYIVILPCTFLAPLIYQFTGDYLGSSNKKITMALWVISILGFIAFVTGIGGRIDGVTQYSWGNIYRFDSRLQRLALFVIPVGLFAYLSSAWRLVQARKTEASALKRRHMSYMAVSFVMLSLANIKLAVLYDVDHPLLLPVGMLMNDLFSAVIAIAIVKDSLLDITVIVKKGAIYSAAAGMVLFVFSFTEHILITTMGEWIGGHSEVIHFVSIGVGILVFMPVKHRLEALVERFFLEKSVAV
jgi:hypothetical protein